MLNSTTINNLLQLSVDNEFLTQYYSNQNKNLWILYYDDSTAIRYIDHSCIEYPPMTNKIICIVLCRGFDDQTVKEILKKEKMEVIPHFDLYQFLRRAVHHFNLYGTYLSQLEGFTVNSYKDFHSIPEIKTQTKIEKMREYKRNYYRNNRIKYQKYYRERYAEYKESMQTEIIKKRGVKNKGLLLRKKMWGKR